MYESLTQKDKREDLLERHQPIYDFRKGDKLASVGAGGGSNEVIYSMMADSLVFYLQDINPTCLTPEILRATVNQLYNAAGRTCTATFTPVIGTEKETRLPSQFFDKIIIENTLHELTHPSDLVASIRANLKPDGYLYVEDFMAKRPGQKHRGCRKPLFTEEALVKLFDVNGFRLVTSAFVYPNNTVNKIYKFALTTK
ncbi:MAG: methyltransferase domain-containing protein [Bacteroidetes bacterium]|nr:methyltransferase domain-containing protein [Fibrella sp.]